MRRVGLVGGMGLVCTLACSSSDNHVEPELAASPAEPAIEPAPKPEPTPEAEPAPAAEPAPEAEPAPAPPTDLADRSPLLFVHAGMLVLDTKASNRWTRGRIVEPPGDPENYRASKPLVSKAVPTRHLAQRERSFDVYGADGKLCTAQLGELRVIAQYGGPRVVDLFAEEDEEYDEANDPFVVVYRDDDPPMPPKPEILARVWKTQPHWLVADLIAPADCDLDKALWARDAVLPPPLILTRSREQNPVTRERARLFEASGEPARVRADYEGWYGALDPEARELEDDWDTMIAQYPLEISSWLDPQGRPRVIELGYGTPGYCGGSGGHGIRVTAFEQVTGNGFVPTGDFVDAAAVFDADLDGRFEVLYHNYGDTGSVRSKTLPVWVDIAEDFDCPC